MHVLELADASIVGAQASDVIVSGALRTSVADFEIPLSVAVTVADWSLVTPLMFATKVAVVA